MSKRVEKIDNPKVLRDCQTCKLAIVAYNLLVWNSPVSHKHEFWTVWFRHCRVHRHTLLGEVVVELLKTSVQ